MAGHLKVLVFKRNSCLCHFDGQRYQWYDPNRCWLQGPYAYAPENSFSEISMCLFLGLQPRDKAALLGVNNTIFSPRIYMETEFSSQGREMHLFLITNMAAVTSRANQQHVCKSSGENYWFAFFLCEYCSLSFLSFVLRHLAIALVGNTEKLRGNRRSPENLIPRSTMQAWMMEAMNIKTGPFKNRFDRLYCSLWIHKKSI